jgi:hypothetical protein
MLDKASRDLLYEECKGCDKEHASRDLAAGQPSTWPPPPPAGFWPPQGAGFWHPLPLGQSSNTSPP